MARTSTRQSAAKANRALAQGEDAMDDEEFQLSDEDEREDEEDEGEYVKPTKKKARSSGGGSSGSGAASKKGKKGALSSLVTTLPLELLASICSYLDLPTVFHLSRLNKRFYSFLRASSMKHVWEKATEESGLPELTAPGMDEVGLANLLFGCCKGCGKATAKVDYVLRIRCCKTCSPDFLWDSREWSAKVYTSLLCLVGSDRQGTARRNHKEYLLMELNTISRLVDECEAVQRNEPENFDDEDDDDDLDSYAGFYHIRSREDCRNFQAACAEIQEQRTTDGAALIAWVREREKEKADKLEEVRVKRRKIIEKRLTERGWKAHHLENPDFQNLALLNVAKPFSETAWPNLRKQLEQFLRDAESSTDAAYLAAKSIHRKRVVEYQYDELCDDPSAAKACGLYPLPPWVEAKELASFKALWTLDKIGDAEKPDPSLEEPSEEMKEELKALRTTFKMDVFERIVDVLRQVEAQQQHSNNPSTTDRQASPSSRTTSSTSRASLLPDPEDGDAYSASQISTILSSTVAAISCSRCLMTDIVPRQLSHNCGSISYSKTRPSFLSHNYTIKPELALSTLKLIELAGQSVDVSAEEMDKLGDGFSCTSESASCVDGVGQNWHRKLEHMTLWRHIDKEDVEIVYETHEKLLERLYLMHLDKERRQGERGEVVEV